MKVLAIGDIHGRTIWEQIVASNEYDKVVFLGDYFDSHDSIDGSIQVENFKKLLKFKRQYPDKVELLIGNHDFHYLKTSHEQYSGYQHWRKWDISEILQPAVDSGEMSPSFYADGVFYTHAGITKTWFGNNFGNAEVDNNADGNVIQHAINNMFTVSPNVFEFTVGLNYDMYGDDICQTPIWVRPDSLKLDKLNRFKQVVGHTYSDGIDIDTTHNIAFIDALGSGHYLIINDGEMLPQKL